jgi:serine/threonine-protein kinase HipA
VKADDVLAVLLGGRRLGTITSTQGRLQLVYDETYVSESGTTPLSLSMPLAGRSYDDSVVRSFLWGLLPDNELVIDRWARSYHVSASNPFALMRHVGADCAGAAQFAPLANVDALLARQGQVEWIDEQEIALRLLRLRRDPAAWHLSRTGQFSLAGAQAKTAMFFDHVNQRWGDPSGATPTTHIIKPAIAGLDDHDLNEHICLQAARRLELSTASSSIEQFADERAIVVERYDRVLTPDGTIGRVHQEDMCQALGLPPTAKYQNEGGPTPERITSLLRTYADSGTQSGPDRFLDALAFNWIIAGTDAHAKNYSLLLAGDQVRIAPLYDVASALPYDDMYMAKLKLAMRIGGQYVIGKIERRHWMRFATVAGFDPEEAIRRIDDLAARTPDAFADAIKSASVRDLESPLPQRLLDAVSTRAVECQRVIAG